MISVAIDYGRFRIGIAAIGDHGVVFPVAVIQNRSRAVSLTAVCDQLAELDAQHIVVGYPLNMDGTVGPQARAAEKFADELRLISGLPVELYDERLSSFEARERLADRHNLGRASRTRPPSARLKRGAAIDAIAACVILESWIQSRAR